MPSIEQTAYTSGKALWNMHEHKKGILDGLKIDNKSIYDEKISLYDGFTTDSSKTNAAGAAQASEDLGTSHVLSGKVRLQVTVPSGEFISFGKEDLQEITFLGKAWVMGDTTSSDCIVVAQYHLS